MDKNTVFVKTKDGEEAMRQRTRLVQRNLRNILIMVDGHASVADLCRRFGDEHAAQAALAELLAGGFIEAPASPLDFTASRPPSGATAGKAEDVPVLTAQVVPPALDAETEPPAIEEIELTAPEYESLPPPPPRRNPAPVVPGTGWMGRIKSVLATGAVKPVGPPKKAQEPDYPDDEAVGAPDLAPIRRGSGMSVGWPLLALYAVVGVAVLLVLTLLLYPYGRHLQDIERSASAMLQDPVKVGDVGFSFLPRPHIALSNITVGKDAHLTVASARAVPDFLSLLGSRKVFRELTLNRVVVKAAGLGRLAPAGAAPVEIRQLILNDLTLTVGDAVLGGLGGEVRMTAAGAPETILLHNADNTLKLELQPKGEGFAIAASGSAWKTPFKPNLTFQALDVQGVLHPSRLDLSKVDGRAYDGLIEGKATLDWSGGAMLAGDLVLKHMNSTRLLAALGSDLSAEGELGARLKLDARAEGLGRLAEALRVSGSFEMKRGAARGFDLGEAVRSTGRGATRGGETKFEQLTGMVHYSQQACRLGDLRLASGLLTAGGNLGIASDGKLNGTVNVELKSSAAILRMPLAIGGTTKDPMLTPSRGR